MLLANNFPQPFPDAHRKGLCFIYKYTFIFDLKTAFGKPVYVRGVLYLDDVPEDDSANDAGDSSVDKPGDADNEEPENGGGNNDADLPPEREEAPSEYENDGNTATIGYGELKTLGAESRYEEIKMLNGMKDNVLSVGFVLLIP